MNPLQPHWDYGLSSFDIRHAASISGTYDVPAMMVGNKIPRSGAFALAGERHSDRADWYAFLPTIGIQSRQ